MNRLTRWIIPKNPIRHDDFLSFRVPSIRSEPCFGLGRRWGHIEICDEPDDEGDQSLDQEQPSPPGVS